MEKSKAFLIHGLGNNAYWWDPFLLYLEKAGLEPIALRLPSLEKNGPECWVELVDSVVQTPDCFLIGYSLGAVTAFNIALQKKVNNLILLSMPFFTDDYICQLPESIDISKTTYKKLYDFIAQTSKKIRYIDSNVLYVIGQNDCSIDYKKAEKLPFKVLSIPGVDHHVNKSQLFIEGVYNHIISAQNQRTIF